MDNPTVTKLISLLKPHGIRKIGIFGSFARGDFNEESDIDVLIDFSERKSLLEIVHIENEVSENLGRKVELLTEKAISPYLIEKSLLISHLKQNLLKAWLSALLFEYFFLK